MSSYRQPIMKTFNAGADLSASQYCFVKFGADSKTVVLCGAGEVAIGILMNAPNASGKPAEVALPGGGGLIKLGGTVARGGEVKSDASGNGVAGATTNWIGGIAYDSGVSGDVIEVYVVAQYKP